MTSMPCLDRVITQDLQPMDMSHTRNSGRCKLVGDNPDQNESEYPPFQFCTRFWDVLGGLCEYRVRVLMACGEVQLPEVDTNSKTPGVMVD